MTARLNGCHNRPRPVAGTPLLVQDGWIEIPLAAGLGATRVPNMVTVPFVMNPGCQYTLRTPDPRCTGCDHEFKPTDAPAAQDNGQT